MASIVQPLAILPTMGWVYAASALLLILFVLLVAPYFGVYGTRNINTDPSQSARNEPITDTENPDQ